MDPRMRVMAVILTVIMLVTAIYGLSGSATTILSTPTDNPLTATVPAVVFPTVPPGGMTLTAATTYFHPSGVISLPYLLGWDLPQDGGEEVTEPPTPAAGTTPDANASTITRVGTTFINSAALSVIHVFAEKDPARKVAAVADLDGYYTKANLDGAWVNFKGGYKELNRGVQGDLYILNFELYLDSSTYLARIVSRLNGDWLMVARLVVPNNNAQLLDQLQAAVFPKFQLWPQALTSPLKWRALADPVSGYVVKFPSEWHLEDGAPGYPYTVTASLGTDTVTLTTHGEASKGISGEADVRAYAKTTWPSSTVQSVKAITVGQTAGFAVSYTNPDSDGNQHSAVANLLNANGMLYVINFQSLTRKTDLLDTTNKDIPAELDQVRDSFFPLPLPEMVPTLTPSPTIPVPTALPTTPAAATAAATTVPTTAPTSTSAATAAPATAAATVPALSATTAATAAATP